MNCRLESITHPSIHSCIYHVLFIFWCGAFWDLWEHAAICGLGLWPWTFVACGFFLQGDWDVDGGALCPVPCALPILDLLNICQSDHSGLWLFATFYSSSGVDCLDFVEMGICVHDCKFICMFIDLWSSVVELHIWVWSASLCFWVWMHKCTLGCWSMTLLIYLWVVLEQQWAHIYL